MLARCARVPLTLLIRLTRKSEAAAAPYPTAPRSGAAMRTGRARPPTPACEEQAERAHDVGR